MMGSAKIYRLRNTQRLLKDKELDDQYIYFASAEELNDPMEGLRDFVWRGDKIVWRNLIRHYLRCLQMFYITYLILSHHEPLTANFVRVHRMPHLPKYFDERGQALFDELCRSVFARARVHDLISHMQNRAIRKDELLHYLTSIHATAVVEVHNIFAKHRIGQVARPIAPPPQAPSNSFVDSPGEINREQSDVLFTSIQRFHDDRHLNQKRAKMRAKSLFERNINLLILDFPAHYVRRIEDLVYPRWYAACFSNAISSSSSWGHYGDGHRGVCLVFSVETNSSGESMSLVQERADFDFSTGEYGKPTRRRECLSFRRVEYSDKPLELDFFRNIGTITLPEAMEEWYTGSDGDISDCATHLGANISEWQERRWREYHCEIERKNIDWKYEEESRLVLTETFHDLQPAQFRRLRYDFESLHGVVFGINTSEDDKIRIIDIVERKCQEAGRSEFGYYQAYYEPSDGSIGMREVRIE